LVEALESEPIPMEQQVGHAFEVPPHPVELHGRRALEEKVNFAWCENSLEGTVVNEREDPST
jgi:hypothetical protein